MIWLDLNIQSDEFVHSSNLLIILMFDLEVVEAINLINDYKEQLNYIPTKIFYQEVSLET